MDLLQTAKVIIGISDVVVSLVFIALAVPLMRRRVPRNGVFGFRIRKAYKSDENWYAINEYGGRRILIWSIPIAICGLIAMIIPMSHATLGWFSYAPLLITLPIIETIRFARDLDK